MRLGWGGGWKGGGGGGHKRKWMTALRGGGRRESSMEKIYDFSLSKKSFHLMHYFLVRGHLEVMERWKKGKGKVGEMERR